MAELFIATRSGDDDRFTRERRLFELLVACERAAHTMRHAPSERERLLDRVHRYLRDRPASRLNVGDLAAGFGINRSNFSHRFRAVTG